MGIAESLIINTDGGSRGNPGPAATGIVISAPDGKILHAFGNYLGIATNNEAEYQAVIDALDFLLSPNSPIPPNPLISLSFRLDSKLVVEQVSRRWKIKEPRLFEFATKIWNLIQANNLSTTFSYVPRAENSAADAEVNQCLDSQSP